MLQAQGPGDFMYLWYYVVVDPTVASEEERKEGANFYMLARKAAILNIKKITSAVLQTVACRV